jgi:hypothetical protein
MGQYIRSATIPRLDGILRGKRPEYEDHGARPNKVAKEDDRRCKVCGTRLSRYNVEQKEGPYLCFTHSPMRMANSRGKRLKRVLQAEL